jgi:hypothetical protein
MMKVIIFKYIVTSIFLLLSSAGYKINAQELGQLNNQSIAVNIQPQVCVVEKQNQRCKEMLVLKINYKIQQRFCVFNRSTPKIKTCFAPEASEQFIFQVDTDKTTHIIIEDEESRLPLTSAILKVVQYRPVRKRRNYGWNFF